MTRPFVIQEMAKLDSIQPFATVPPDWRQMEWTHTAALETHLLSGRSARTEVLLGDYGRFWRRMRSRRASRGVCYDYFVEHTKTAGVATPKLLSYEGLWGGGEEYAYEVLNFANGNGIRRRFAMRFRRSTGQYRWRWCWSIFRRWRRLEWWNDEVGGFKKRRGGRYSTIGILPSGRSDACLLQAGGALLLACATSIGLPGAAFPCHLR